MQFPCVNLFDHAANAWPVSPDNDKQILRDKSQLRIVHHDFEMGESLSVGTDLILTLHNQDSTIPQHAKGFFPCLTIEF